MEHQEIDPAGIVAAAPAQPVTSRTIGCRADSSLRPPANGQQADADAAVRAACLERLATALSSFNDLQVTVWADGAEPCLAAYNKDAPVMSETVTVRRLGDDLAFMWSWDKRIGDASDPDGAAHAIAYVLSAADARLRAK